MIIPKTDSGSFVMANLKFLKQKFTNSIKNNFRMNVFFKKIACLFSGHLYWEQILITFFAFIILTICINTGLPNDKRMKFLMGGNLSDTELQRLSALQKYYKALHIRLEKNNEVIPSFIRKNYVYTEEDSIIAFRSFSVSSSAVDERRVYGVLFDMNPKKLDFNPKKLYVYGGSYLYVIGGMLSVAKSFRLFAGNSDLAYCVRHPEQIAFLFKTGRWLNIGMFIGILVLLSRLGAIMHGRFAATISMLMWSCSTLALNYSITSKPHIYVAFWVFLSFYFFYQYSLSKSYKQLLLSGIALGWAVGASMPSAIIILYFFVIMIESKHLQLCLKQFVLLLAITLGVFIVTNPYVVITFDKFIVNMVNHIECHITSSGIGMGLININKLPPFLIEIFTKAYAFPISLAAITGFFYMIINSDWRMRRFAIGFIIIIFIIGITMSNEIFGFVLNSRIFLFIGPFMCLFTGFGIAKFYEYLKSPFKQMLIGFLSIGFIIAAFFVGIFIWGTLNNDFVLNSFEPWVNHISAHDNISIGIFGKSSLNPVVFPPFPIMKTRIMNFNSSEKQTEKPDYVLLSYINKDLERWKSHHFYENYDLYLTYGKPKFHDRFLRWRIQTQSIIAGWVYKKSNL